VTELRYTFYGAENMYGYGLMYWNLEKVQSFRQTFGNIPRISLNNDDACDLRFLVQKWSNISPAFNTEFVSSYTQDWIDTLPSSCSEFNINPDDGRRFRYYIDELARGSCDLCPPIENWDISNFTNLDFIFCADKSSWKCSPVRRYIRA